MRIDYSRRFIKQLKKAPLDIQKAVRNRIELFAFNQQHPLLRNHKLTGIYEGCRSINITGDWRAIYEEYDELFEPYMYFSELGTHSKLYK